MNYKIIVAKYNENVDWLQNTDKTKLIVYDKGDTPILDEKIQTIKRVNVGREGETFLFYILENYDNLPDYMVFIQAFPFDHANLNSQNFQEKINELIQSSPTETIPLFRELFYENHGRCHSIYSPEYYKFILGFVDDTSVFSPGGQYLVKKSDILSKPIDFYKRIHAMLLNNDITNVDDLIIPGKFNFSQHVIHGWALERLFYYIFNSKKIESIPSYMVAKRYLVTGGAGKNGSYLVGKLLNEGKNVIIVDNLSSGTFSNISDFLQNFTNQLHFLNGDVNDSNILFRVGMVEEIYHMTGLSKLKVNNKMTDNINIADIIKYYYNENIGGTVELVKYSNSFSKPINIVYGALLSSVRGVNTHT